MAERPVSKSPVIVWFRRAMPELAKMPTKYIHRPWEVPTCALKDAGVDMGRNYPRPIVNHKFARERALAAYKFTRSSVNNSRFRDQFVIGVYCGMGLETWL